MKIFLDASAEARAERRYNQLKNKGLGVNLRDLLEQIQERDARDRDRAVAPLRPAEDTLIVDSTHMTIDEVVETVMARLAGKLSEGSSSVTPPGFAPMQLLFGHDLRGIVFTALTLTNQRRVPPSAGSHNRHELPRLTNTMSESFADLFEESLNTIEMAPGSIVTGTVVDIDDDWVVVHAGLKSEGVIPKNQFFNEEGVCTLSIGDRVKVAMEVVDDGFGETRLSRESASR